MDADGFVEPSPATFDFKQLFDTPCTVVVAPPWIGKTTVAKSIFGYLRQTSGKLHDGLDFGERTHSTLFEEYITGPPLQPPWWDDWATDGNGPSCWIVDAIDEARHLAPRFLDWLVGHLKGIPADRRTQLRLVLLGRSAEIPKKFLASLQEIYGENHRRVELLPLDRLNAERQLGPERLERVVLLMRRCGLRYLARFPAVLDFLKDQGEETDIAEGDVWRGVLQKLLEDPGPLRNSRRACEKEERFQAAAHLAAVLTFSGIEEIGSEDSSPYETARSLADLMPKDIGLNRPAAGGTPKRYVSPNIDRF